MNAPLEPPHSAAAAPLITCSVPAKQEPASAARPSAREIEKLPADMLGKTSSWAERGTAMSHRSCSSH